MEGKHECESVAQACSDFIIDLCASGQVCRCGFPKSAHSNTDQIKRRLTPVHQLRLAQSNTRDGHPEACKEYTVDLTSNFGLCQCGFARSDHASVAFIPRDRRLSRNFLQRAQNDGDSANETGACSDFMIDPLSAARHCRCGFPKSAHGFSSQMNRERTYSDTVQALRQNFSGGQVPSFASTCPQMPKSSDYLVSAFDRFQAYRSVKSPSSQRTEEVVCTESITCACGNELSVTKEELEILILVMPDYESKTVAELIEFFSSLIPGPEDQQATRRSLVKKVTSEHQGVMGLENLEELPWTDSTMTDTTDDSLNKLSTIDSPRTASSSEPVDHLLQVNAVDDESLSASSDIATSERVDMYVRSVDEQTAVGMEGVKHTLDENSLSGEFGALDSENVKSCATVADVLTTVVEEHDALVSDEVRCDEASENSNAFQRARAKWTEAAQKAAEDAEAERAAAEEQAAKLRLKEADAAAAARRREETQAAKQREKELKALEEEQEKIQADAAQNLAESQKVVEELAELEKKSKEEHDTLLSNAEVDEAMMAKKLEEMQLAKTQMEEKRAIEEEKQKQIHEESARKMVVARELIAQRERIRLRKAAEREAEALRQAEYREEVARVKAAELVRRRTVPISCNCGSELMVTPDEKDALYRYVPEFQKKTAEELAQLLPNLHMGAWLHGSRHLFAKT